MKAQKPDILYMSGKTQYSDPVFLKDRRIIVNKATRPCETHDRATPYKKEAGYQRHFSGPIFQINFQACLVAGFLWCNCKICF